MVETRVWLGWRGERVWRIEERMGGCDVERVVAHIPERTDISSVSSYE